MHCITGPFPSTAKVFVERSHPKTPLAVRTANVNLTESQSVRKALGSLNRPLATTKTQFPKGKKFLLKKVSKANFLLDAIEMLRQKKLTVFVLNNLE